MVLDIRCSNPWILASIIHNLNYHIRHSPIAQKKKLRKKNYFTHKFSKLFHKPQFIPLFNSHYFMLLQIIFLFNNIYNFNYKYPFWTFKF